MANNTNPFLTAHYEKTVLTEQTAKRIQRIYKQSAQDIEKKLHNLRMVNPSDSLKKVYFENLLKDINKSSASFDRLVQSTVMNAGERAGGIAVDAGNKMMKMAGVEIKGAYSYIPRQQVLNIASGKLYGDSWSLSKAIWKNGIRTKSDIQNVVAKGLMENKPIKDIADDLMKYVDPTARKPWDWSKVYPGTAAKVDYNAQRLARTMIQHSFQASLVQSQRYNPFCKGVIWHSVGIHGRTCELCLERDGNVFPVKDLPLDHPNGLCYFEPALDDMNAIADRLADWAKGGSDPDLDNYVAKAFNMNLSSRSGQGKIEEAKNSVSPRIKRGKSIKSAERKSSQKVVQGKDISATWTRRSDKFDFEIEDVINAQGFDGKPRIVSAKEFDEAVKDSKFIAQRTYSAESQEILEAYRKQLYEGKWYVDCGTGGAQYGQGMYCAADYTGALSDGIKAEMSHYQRVGYMRNYDKAVEEWTKSLSLNAMKNSNYYDKAVRSVSDLIDNISEREFSVWKKLKSTGLSGYQLPEKEIEIWEEMLNNNKFFQLENIYDDMKLSSNFSYNYVETFTLHPSAKIIEYDDLLKRRKSFVDDWKRSKAEATFNYDEEWKNATMRVYVGVPVSDDDWGEIINAGAEKGKKFIAEHKDEWENAGRKIKEDADKFDNMDDGSFATMLGYDAINAVGHGESGSYTVILNRTKLIIKQP